MRNRSKLLLAGLTAALAFGAFVSVSSANRIGTKNSSTQWRATWNALKFIGASGFANIECHVTIEGSFHSKTISKVLEALVGYVSRVTVDETRCTGGSARAFGETLPWHIRYAGFTGALPKIESIKLRQVNAKFRVQALIFGVPVPCEFQSTASSPMVGTQAINTTTGVAETLTPEAAAIPKTSGSSTCGNEGRLERPSTALTEGATTTRITVTLVA